MKRFMLILAFLIAGVLIISSCSDSDKSTDAPVETGSDYYPSKIGNYWVYQNDANIGEDNANSYQDSVVISSVETIKGKKAFRFSSFIFGSDNSHDEIYRIDGDKLYTLSADLLSQFGVLFDVSAANDDWSLIANVKELGSWSIAKQEHDGLVIFADDEGNVATFKGQIELLGVNQGEMPLQTPVGVLNAIQNDLIISVKGTVKAGVVEAPLEFEILQSVYFSEGIGRVMTESKKQKVTLMGQVIFDEPHTKSMLLRYNVVK